MARKTLTISAIPPIEIKPAKELALLLFSTHIGAILCVTFLMIELLFKLVLIGGCLISLCYLLRRNFFLASPKSIVKIKHEAENSWCLYQKDGSVVSASLKGNSIVNTYFILLNFRIKTWQSATVMVFKTGISATDFRRLRVQLFNQKWWAEASLKSSHPPK